MSEYRHVVVCHDCNTKSIDRKCRIHDTCPNCGSHKFKQYMEQDRKGKELHKFLDGKSDFVDTS
jgi:predicted  nucleic acid-binding Zn-ribbon protein